MIASCKVLQETHEDVKCLGIGQDSTGPIRFNWWAYWVPWVRGYGGDVLSEDGTQSTLSSPEALAGLQAYADLWAKHDVAIPIGAEFGGNCFVNQRCAVWFHIPIFASVFRDQVEEGAFEWDTQVIPSLPEGKFTGMGTFGYAVSSGTEHPQEAWDFVKAVASPTGQRIMGSKYEVMPLLKSLSDDSLWDELDPPPANYKNTFVDGQAYGTLPSTYPTDCGSLYQGQVHDAITSALETVIRGRATAEEVFPDVDAQIQACLDRAN
jgi:ABC-type glycerol-3-phosphate transport system substrate-binding protein